MSTASRLLKNTGFLYIRLGLTLFISLWTTRIILNALGSNNFGIYSLVGGVISLLGFLNSTLSTSTQRYINFAEGEGLIDKKKEVFVNSLILHIVLGIILIVAFSIIGYFCFRGILDIPVNRLKAAEIVFCCMTISSLLSVMNVPYEAVINAHENMGYYAFIGIIEVILKLIIAILITIIKYDRLIVYGILMMSVPLITLTIMKIYCYKVYPECRNLSIKLYNPTILKALTSFAGWNFTNSATGVLNQYGLNIVVNHYFGVGLNAAQGIATQVSGVLISLSSNALKAINPIIVKSESQHRRDRMLYLAIVGCKISFFIFGLICIPLIFLMDKVLALWLDNVPKWTEIFCQLQLIRVCSEMLTYSLNTAIIAQGDIKFYNIIRSIINISPIFIIIILFNNNYAPYWMYIIWILMWSVMGGINTLVFTHVNTGLSYIDYIKMVLLPCIGVVLISIIPMIIEQFFIDIFIYKIGSVCISVILYLVFSWLWLLNSSEKNQLKTVLVNLMNIRNNGI